jgi:membrane protein required for colicin V production
MAQLMIFQNILLEVNVNLRFSLFNFLIAGTLVWGMYKGYVQGFIVQTIAFFALLIGVFIAAKLSMAFYNVLVDKSTVSLRNLPVIAFSVMFGPVLFGANWAALYVLKQVSSAPKTIYTKILGSLFGGLKYLFIASIFLIFIYRLDKSFNIITDGEKEDAFMFKPVMNFSTSIMPVLEFDVRPPKAEELDDFTTEPESEMETEPE